MLTGNLVIGAPCGLAGLWVVLREILRVWHVRDWPTVIGRIVVAEQGDDAGAFASGPVLGLMYEYHVEGSTHTGSIELPRLRAGSLTPISDVTDRYFRGRQLRIAYNPRRIAQSEIADDAQRNLDFGAILGGLFFIAFAFVCFRHPNG